MRPLAPLPLVAAPPGPCPRRVAHVAHRRRRPAPGAHRTKPHGVLPIEVNRVDALNTKWMPRAVAAVAAKQGPGAAAHVAHIVIGARLTRGGGRIAALPIGFITRWAAQPAPHHPRRPRCAPDLWLRQRGQAVARADAIAAVVAKSPVGKARRGPAFSRLWTSLVDHPGARLWTAAWTFVDRHVARFECDSESNPALPSSSPPPRGTKPPWSGGRGALARREARAKTVVVLVHEGSLHVVIESHPCPRRPPQKRPQKRRTCACERRHR